MAITATLYELLKSLDIDGASLLEIGEANWYGDLEPASVGLVNKENLFDVAKDFYASWFAPTRLVAIDMNGSPAALQHDLNGRIDLGERFDVVINNGTAEHIFNIGQVFKTIHDHCDLIGWMIHDAPFFGWVDHGFYCLQPTLFYDLAMANCYEVNVMAIHECKSRQIIRLNGRDHISELHECGSVPMNSALFVALRKRVDQPFKAPMQGYYARNLSDVGNRAWQELR